MFGGYATTRLLAGVVLFPMAMAWLPWMLLLWDRLLESLEEELPRRPWDFCALVAVIAIDVLVGAPQIAFYNLAALCLYALITSWNRKSDDLDPEELKPARQYLTDELAAASPFGTIEVEFSELNAMQGKTLGFDLSEALSDTTEQPKLGESPRINLEGLGSNFDLNRELREMLEEFAPEEQSAAANSSAETSLSATDIDYDLEDTGEVTQPRLDEQTGAHDEQDSYESEATRTVAIKPFSMGLDLDLGLHNPQQPLDELDFSLDEEIDQAAAQKDSDDTRD